MKQKLLIIFFFFSIITLAQEGAIYNKWYLNELNVKGKDFKIPNTLLLHGDGLVSPMTYGEDPIFEELGEVTKFTLRAGGCVTLNLLGNIVDHEKFQILAFGSISTSICTSRIENFTKNYNLTSEETAFYNAAKFFHGNGEEYEPYLLYYIEDDGKKLKIVNKDGEFAIYRLTPFNLLSTNELDAKPLDLIVYPNPIETSFKLTLPNNFDKNKTSLTIINSAAIIVKEFKASATEFNISNLPTGVYILIVNDGKNVLNTKIIKR